MVTWDNLLKTIPKKIPGVSALGGSRFSKYFSRRSLLAFILAVVVALFLVQNKNWLIAGLVNGRPIWRWQLEDRLVKRYAAPTLDELINEQLIRQAAAKKGVTVTSRDVDNRIADVEKTLQGKITLSDALAQQGMTMSDFRNQIELQLFAEKLTANQADVKDSDIDDYIAKNKTTLTATDAAGMRTEAKQILITQKRSTAFQQLFSQLKSQAKIQRFF